MNSAEITIILEVDKNGFVEKFRSIKNTNREITNQEHLEIVKYESNQPNEEIQCPQCHYSLVIRLYMPKKTETNLNEHKIEENKEQTKFEEGDDTKIEPFAIDNSHPFSDDSQNCTEIPIKMIRSQKTDEINLKRRKNIKLKKTQSDSNAIKSEFSCSLCHKSFKNKLSLSTHKRYCSSDRLNTTCNDCDKTFQTYYSFNIHKQTVHAIHPRHQCKICERAFISPSKLEEHIAHKHKNLRHPCHMCEATFTNKYVLLSHMREKHNLDLTLRRTCKICTPARRFQGDFELSEHLLEEHGIENDVKNGNVMKKDDLRCISCNVSFKNSMALTTHGRYCNPDMPRIGKPTCKHCGKCYSTWYTVKDHIKTEHLGILLQCELCGKQLRSKSDLEEHILRHTNPKPFCCHHCDKRFVNKERIKFHIIAKHLNQANYICEVCSKRFVQENDMNKHKSLVHSDVRPFACSECPVTFKTDTYLKNHMYAMHTPTEMKRKFHCQTCDFVTTKSHYLENHQKIHLDDSLKLPCAYCGRRFVDEKQKLKHEMIHTGERPHLCECGQSFKTRVEKREHFIKAHTQDRPFVCEICREGYADRWQYRNHLNKHEAEMGVTLNKSVRRFMFKYKHI